MSPSRGRRLAIRAWRLASQWPGLLVLTTLWIMLWGDLSWANVLGGLALAVLVVTVFPLPPIATHGTLRPRPFLALASWFVADLVVASFEVAWMALRPAPPPRGGVVGVRLHNLNDVFLTMTAELVSLVPGSVVVDAQRRTGMLYLHVLDLAGSGGTEGVRAKTLALEARVLRAFATDEELARLELGSPPHELVRQGASRGDLGRSFAGTDDGEEPR